jgi:hypothetical protein
LPEYDPNRFRQAREKLCGMGRKIRSGGGDVEEGTSVQSELACNPEKRGQKGAGLRTGLLVTGGNKSIAEKEEPFDACALFDIQPQCSYNQTAIKEFIFRIRRRRKNFASV